MRDTLDPKKRLAVAGDHLDLHTRCGGAGSRANRRVGTGRRHPHDRSAVAQAALTAGQAAPVVAVADSRGRGTR